MENILKEYVNDLYSTYFSGNVTEGSFYPHISNLIKLSCEYLNHSFDVIVLPSRTTAGYPDGKVMDKGEIVGYFECKALGENLDSISQTEQIQRYINYFENFILTNYLEFWFYRNGSIQMKVRLLDYKNFEKGIIDIKSSVVSNFKSLMEEFSNFRIPSITHPEILANYLAKRVALLKEKLKILLKINKEAQDIYGVFRDSFIKNMDEENFCDTLAQAFSYSLLIAKLYTPSGEDFKPQDVLILIPENLKLVKDFFSLLYTDINDNEIANIIDDLANILNKFEPLSLFTKGLTVEDLVTHFYEPFLKKYNPDVQEIRGVYFTPPQVVSFMVRCVDDLLRGDKFGLKDGLGAQSENVKILDPAAGTLTFIIHALNKAIETVKLNYGEGVVKDWIRSYGVKNFYAFELLPSAYVIGHLRISVFLRNFEVNEKFNLYLTNTLELEHDFPLYPIGLLKDMSDETLKADKIKKETPIMVIIGNPPYSGISANMEAELTAKLRENWDGCQSYYEVDGKMLKERKVWLQDDYVKFIRFGQWKINQVNKGILVFITNHAYLDNPTFRGMRQSLLKTFDRIYILNLHGNKRKKEPDENVFDIQQGVAIGIFVKDGSKQEEYAEVYYADTLEMGLLKREEKYRFLEENNLDTINWHKLEPRSPFYFFVPHEDVKRFKSLGEFKINEIFEIGVTGIVTARDKLVIGFTEEEVENKIKEFLDDKKFSDSDIREKYNLQDNYAWKLTEKRNEAISKIKSIKEYIKPVLYRPFDVRYIFYHPLLVFRSREKVMKHFDDPNNIGLVTHKREEIAVPWSHIFVTKCLVEHGALSSKTTNYVFPLYKSQKFYGSWKREINFTDEFKNFLNAKYPSLPKEEIFYYIYAILYSECYRSTYEPELMYDFPSIPFLEDPVVRSLIPLGKRLVELHTDWKNSAHPLGRFPKEGNNIVNGQKVRYEDGKLFINDVQYFENVPQKVWEYRIGSYQVLEKWLKERDGRKISTTEDRFMEIMGAIMETIQIQKKIDNYLRSSGIC